MSGAMTLQGKHALVTGSSRGIGRGIAQALAVRGCNVAVHYVRKEQAATETVAALTAQGVQAVAIKANLARAGEAQRLVDETADRLGGLDIFVGNAASGVLKPASALQAKDWDWTMDINARSILAAVQAALPYMQAKQWGRIITVTSIGSRRVRPEYSMVGISKAALEAMTRYLAVELAPSGIIANCISPGLVLTGALDTFDQPEEMAAYARRHTPAGRLVTPEDIGNVAAWLCTEEAVMIVGQTLEVDGGYGLLMLGSMQ